MELGDLWGCAGMGANTTSATVGGHCRAVGGVGVSASSCLILRCRLAPEVRRLFTSEPSLLDAFLGLEPIGECRNGEPHGPGKSCLSHLARRRKLQIPYPAS